MVELFRKSDGAFNIRAWVEPNRNGTSRYRIRYRYAGGENCQVSAASEAEALTKCAGIWQAHLSGFLDAPEPEPVTVGDLVDKFVKREKLSPASRRSYERALHPFLAAVSRDRPLEYIGRGAIEKWLGSLTCKEVSKQTYLRTLSALFKWGKREKFCKDDPTAEVRVQLARSSHAIRPWLQFPDWPPFLAACGPSHRIRAEFVLHTGLRASELVGADWTWLHGTVGRPAITVPASKSARARAIPLDDRAIELLEEAKGLWGNEGYMFSKGSFGKGNLRRDTVEACLKAKVRQVDFHGLRRSCGARWLECGVPLFYVSRMLGHADVSTTAKYYAGLADSTLAAEIDRVSKANKTPPTP